ncbi:MULTISPECIES: TetR/AcrR family transcriptional regulator [Pseudoalteromonas]|uniref:TetR family transcriptional regulator n=1 Tax=Pseudoalteromonas amylolytica TaxID=1859457 RepID=A0A1S1MPN8_9GAMM|nr:MULTISPECIES: TetR/AcrR family transcriptional regulator [Pseudoalteromonas]OHU84283.1 TetR family transcriptional regulator [Pseudoalteromonas sp. JW3]OHU87177.1 TetR family transcriptional regulator [Pseudoalteromonas amylolytica]
MGKGKQTKQQVLATALNIATATSLNDLTIGGLAAATGMSKSGLFAHFNSKENLQLAVLEHAKEIFVDTVIKPVDTNLSALAKLLKTCELWQSWYQEQACTCIFISAAVEFDDQPGSVRDSVKSQLQHWLNYLNKLVDDAITEQSLAPQTDAKQFTYELYSLYLGSQHMTWVGLEDDNHSRFNLALQNLVKRHQGAHYEQ